MSTAIGQLAIDAASAGVDLLGVSSPAPLASARAASARLGDRQVRHLLTQVGRARAALEQAEAALVAEGIGRGLPRDEGLSSVDWIRTHEGACAAPPEPAHAARLARFAEIPNRRGDVCERVLSAFASGELSARKTDQILKFIDEAAPVADEDELIGIIDTLVTSSGDGSVPGVRTPVDDEDPLPAHAEERAGDRADDPSEVGDESYGADPSGEASDESDTDASGELTDTEQSSANRPSSWGLLPRELAAAIRFALRLIKPDKQLHDEEREARRGCGVFRGPGPGKLIEYRVLADAEGSAILDAALDALSQPVKGPEGQPDPRLPSRRRYDALIDLVQRAVAAGGSAPRTHKAQVVVTTTLTSLLAKTAGAGVTMNNEVLSPAAVRRLACDAQIIPMVLGGEGEILDVGRSVRLFSGAQRVALWHRDRGCTYPGCTVPAMWCDAHHVVHWADGGATDLDNAALLCRRHHTLVHDQQHTATVTPTGVSWLLPRFLAAS
ncbi:HNH endonuclease signature motif containing protein [Rudaeicoccus suwonensis]|nr:HNH endonuclease signature motif containing protein [Rudaeicoccus suwonensis]